MAEVILKNISKKFGKFLAIDDLNLEISDGEFLILVGPSGCGKSTALRMIAGLESVTSGSMSIGDNDVVDLPPKERDIAMVFQSYALYPHMNVFNNIAFSMKLAGISKAERKEHVLEIAKTLQLTPLLDRRPANLSGGQRQRVAMGRAMVRKPAAFLMDEPLSNLDAKLRVQMRAEIASLQRKLGVTMIYVTHDQIEAMTMGDRVAVMKNGILQQVDSPKALYETPVNAFVAGFIGSPSMNLFEAKLEGTNLHTSSFTIPLQNINQEKFARLNRYIDKDIIFGIRPEDFYEPEEKNSETFPTVPARITSIEELGSENIVHFHLDAVQVDSGDPDAVSDLSFASNAVAKIQPRNNIRPETKVQLAVDVDRMHFFDPLSHLAI